MHEKTRGVERWILDIRPSVEPSLAIFAVVHAEQKYCFLHVGQIS